ncbi:MAG: 6,7-dimethyl-8-ribityllumazine synthase [Betaproteobacteria bacterium]|nr:6,7-dimethyl-8-ribityllumazine synthase [Betaproteobacteria bacterium]
MVIPQSIVSGHGLRIGLVRSRFNDGLVSRLAESCLARLIARGVAPEAIDTVAVPGALEIPVALQAMAVTRRYDALVALGAVVRGETYHFEVVANESCRGVMDVMLDTGVPIANGILTVENEAQAEARVGKGADCADCAIEMAAALQGIHVQTEKP